MSRRKDRERAKHHLFRDGHLVPVAEIERKKKEAQDAKDEERARKMGLLLPGRGKSKLVVPGDLIAAGLIRGEK